MNPMFSLSLRLSLAVLLLSMTSLFAGEPATPYKPLLPYTSPTEKILVVDLQQDKNNAGTGFYTEAEDVVYAASVLQGLINRQSDTKVYLLNMPMRFYWNNEHGDIGNPQYMMLDDAFTPCQKEYVELDNNKRFPALSWLVQNYSHLLKGMILAPHNASGYDHVGARNAAITACAFEDALYAPPIVEDYLRQEGVKLPVIANTRDMGRVEAFNWSVTRYLNDPKRCRNLVAFHDNSAQSGPAMVDYWVATRTFCFFLMPREKKELELFPEILNESNYPAGTFVIGGPESVHAINPIQNQGYIAGYGPSPNVSVLSSFRVAPEKLTPPAAAKPLPIDPNGLYVALNCPDGDAIDFLYQSMLKSYYYSPSAGTYPMGIKLSPYLYDLSPTVFAWYTRQYPETANLITCLNDGHIPRTPEGAQAYQDIQKHYAANVNGNLQVANFFGTSAQATSDIAALYDIGYRDVMVGVSGRRNEVTPEWTMKEGVLFYYQIGWAWHEAEQVAEDIIRSGRMFPPGTPAFVAARAVSKNGDLAITEMYETVKALRKIDTRGRNLYLVTPHVLSATAHAWFGNPKKGGPAPTPDQVKAANHWKVYKKTAPKPVSELVNDLGSDNELTIRKALWELGRLGEEGKPGVPGMIAALSHDTLNVRISATWALASIGEAPDAAPSLIAALNDAERDVRIGAAYALGRVAPDNKDAVLALTTALNAENIHFEITRNICRSLARMRVSDPACIPPLIRVVLSDSKLGFGAAPLALKRFGMQAVDALAGHLNDPSGEARARVVHAIGYIGGTDAAEYEKSIISILRTDKEAIARQCAVNALAKVAPKSADAHEALLETIRQDSHVYAREMAVQAVAELAVDQPALRNRLREAVKGNKAPVTSLAKEFLEAWAQP